MVRSRKTMPVLLIIVVILIIVLVVTNLNKNKGGSANVNTANESAKNVTETKQGQVEVTDVSITGDASMTNVTAQVTNNDSIDYSTVEVSVIFYDKDKNILATASGLIENLKAGEKKGFSSSISGDFSKSAKYEVKVEKAQ